MAAPHLSVVMASYNRPPLLSRTLSSIRDQKPSFPYELIVVDDGSDGTETAEVCRHYAVRYFRTERAGYCNPGPARNIGYKAARGEIILAQSDDTLHATSDAVELLGGCKAGQFLIATVWEMSPEGARVSQYTGHENLRPFFFLGSLRREDLYAVGGDDEDFDKPGFDDDWLAARLIHGRGIYPNFRADIVGCHQWHPRPSQDEALPWFHEMKAKFKAKLDSRKWVAASGPWPYTTEEG